MAGLNTGQVWIVEPGVDLDERMLKGIAPCKVYSRGCLPEKLQKVFSNAIDLKPFLDDEALGEWISQVTQILIRGENVVYSSYVPADIDAATLKLRQVASEGIHILRSQPPSTDLPADVLPALENGLVTLDGYSLRGKFYPTFSPTQTAMVFAPMDAGLAGEFKEMLLQVYNPAHIVYTRSLPGNDEWNRKTTAELDPMDCSILLIPPRSTDASLESFAGVIAQLRAPNGCPWDRKQTHESLRTYLLEETYEALSAIDSGDMTGLREELGDLVLQILLHAQIAEEKGEFNLSEVLEGINRKIVYRHPHVFGEVKVRDDRDVVQNWEKLKEKERAENGDKEEFGILNGVPKAFPALAQAQAIQDRAARVGFDWDEIDPVKAKVMEEYGEVESAADADHRAKELGDLLFAVVNLVRWYKVDAESALRETNLKFRNRFAYIEKKARETGRELSEMSLADMDVFWEEAKKLDQ